MSQNRVQVFVRPRPTNPPQSSSQRNECLRLVNTTTLELLTPSRILMFDHIFLPESNDDDNVFRLAVVPVVESFVFGYHGAVIAYGQTGAGKTHTMVHGVLPRFSTYFFQRIRDTTQEGCVVEEEAITAVSVSCLEIYNERVSCLLSPSKQDVTLVDHPSRGTFPMHAAQLPVATSEDFMNTIETAYIRRATEATKMNEVSSRSHFVVLVTLTRGDKVSTFSFCDLAGSENVSRSGAEGQRLEEAKHINTSLLVLSQVIMRTANASNTTANGGECMTPVPYRDSKLTRLIRNAFGGNSKTALILCIRTEDNNRVETTSTLRFGLCAGKISNAAVVNVTPTVASLQRQLAEAKKEIELLQSS
eukprot:PhF_6_TR42782/c0_g1_i1/m.64726/K10396/KIF5; kinesin family member 5